MTDSKPNPRETKQRRQNRTLPSLKTTITLNTAFTQRVYNRVWDRLKGDIFILTVRAHAAGMPEVAENAEKIIGEQFESIRKDLDADITRADILIQNLGITELGQYDGALETDAEFTTPQAKTYLDLLLSMDQLIMRVDGMWLHGEIETKACKDRSYEWQRRLIKAANRIREHATAGRRTIEEAQAKRTRATTAAKTVPRPEGANGAAKPAPTPDQAAADDAASATG
jgi:hypothetical protein